MKNVVAGTTLFLMSLVASACPSVAEPLTNQPCSQRGASTERDGVTYYCVLDLGLGKQVWAPATTWEKPRR